MRGRYQISYYPSTLTREPSYIDLTNLLTKETTSFHPKEKVGSGTYGYVRRFSDGTHNLAVKAPNVKFEYSNSEKEQEYRRLRVQAEYTLMCSANPNKTVCALIPVLGQNKVKRNGEIEYHYSYRIVDEFNPGETLYKYLKGYKFDNTKDFARLIMRIAQALQSVHNNKVIHGDVAARNIMLEKIDDDYKVTFIDFGLGYKLDGKAVVGFYDTSDYGELPPERINGKRLDADPAQDVYSFAYLVKSMLNENLSYSQKRALKRDTPCIAEFVELGMKREPARRPDLNIFIQKLRHHLDWPGLSNEMYKLAVAIEEADKKGFSAANKLVEGHANQYRMNDLAELLTYLIEHNNYHTACNLIDFKKNKIPISFYMLFIAAENPDIHEDFLIELIESAHNIELIQQQGFEDNTLLHAAAAAGRLDNVWTLVTAGASLLATNSLNQKPADVATDDIKPILQLLTFIAQRELAQTQRSRLFHGKKKSAEELQIAKKMEQVACGDADSDTLLESIPAINNCQELKRIYDGLMKYEHIKPLETGLMERLYNLLSL